MSLSCIRAKVEVFRIVVCGSCLAVYTCKNSEGSTSKLLLSQMQGACKNYRENLKMSRYEVKHVYVYGWKRQSGALSNDG